MCECKVVKKFAGTSTRTEKIIFSLSWIHENKYIPVLTEYDEQIEVTF